MKIIYYNFEIAEQAVGENQNSCVLAAGTSNAYAQRVAQMEQDSFDDAWTEAMVADSLAQSYNHLWLAEDDIGTPCGYLLANVLGDETELLRIAVNPECRKDGIGSRSGGKRAHCRSRLWRVFRTWTWAQRRTFYP